MDIAVVAAAEVAEVATTTAPAMDITTATTATATTTTATAAMMTTMTARVATTAARLGGRGRDHDGRSSRRYNMSLPLRGMARSTDGPVLAHGPGRRSVQRYQRRCLAARLINSKVRHVNVRGDTEVRDLCMTPTRETQERFSPVNKAKIK